MQLTWVQQEGLLWILLNHWKSGPAKTGPAGPAPTSMLKYVNSQSHIMFKCLLLIVESFLLSLGTVWVNTCTSTLSLPLSPAPDFKTVQREVSDLITGRILVGHGLHHDLKVASTIHLLSQWWWSTHNYGMCLHDANWTSIHDSPFILASFLVSFTQEEKAKNKNNHAKCMVSWEQQIKSLWWPGSETIGSYVCTYVHT